MTEITKPKPGFGAPTAHPVVPPGLRISPFIDYIKLVLRFPNELQPASITKHRPKEWVPFTKVNIAAHLHNTQSTAPNTCNCYTLTIHEPHKHKFCVVQLLDFLHASGATLDKEMSTIEWGIDLYPTKEAPLNRAQLGQLAENITRCLSIQGIGLKLTPQHAVSRKYGKKEPTKNMAKDVANNWTVYIGEQPDWKTDAIQYRWRDCIGFKCYYKVTDRGQALPENSHRLRLEFTASATHCPVDVTKLLDNNRIAKKKLASYFALALKTSGLLLTIQHGKRACCASMSPTMLETARHLHKRPIEIYYSTPYETCDLIHHPKDEVRPSRRRQSSIDSSWNDRITKAFERLTVGHNPMS